MKFWICVGILMALIGFGSGMLGLSPKSTMAILIVFIVGAMVVKGTHDDVLDTIRGGMGEPSKKK